MPTRPALVAARSHVSSDLEAARRVLGIEQAALGTLARSLDERFSAALDLFEGVKGRIIVTGMGKSGHVARKIAATFASTGAPAQFVHPAEASHGDLGMVVPGDAVLALSNSGETPELADLLAYAKRHRLPVVAVTSAASSTLADTADVVLLLPAAEEACSMGVAPTTSTTMMLALGDALAVALLGRRGFSVEDFRSLHPGGRLGKKLLRVADVMREGGAVPVVASGTRMGEAILVMSEKSIGAVGVVAGEALVGIVTDGDLRRHMGEGLVNLTVDEVMTPHPRSIDPHALAAEALAQMNASDARPILVLFVVDEATRPLGVVHLHDLLRAGVA
jgi:arabinose-5-phosphate isomerase